MIAAGTLGSHAKKFLKHLGKESFYRLLRVYHEGEKELMARSKEKKKRKAKKRIAIPDWDREGDEGGAFERKCEEWGRRNWMPWLQERLTFPFTVTREEDMNENPFALSAVDRPFSVGHQMEALRLDDESIDGIMIEVVDRDKAGCVPLADCEVIPKSDPNYWPVREYVVWFANQ